MPLATQFGPLTNSSGSNFVQLSPPTNTVWSTWYSSLTLGIKVHLSQQILGPARSIDPRHTLVIKYTDLKGQGTPESANSPSSLLHSPLRVKVHLTQQILDGWHTRLCRLRTRSGSHLTHQIQGHANSTTTTYLVRLY